MMYAAALPAIAAVLGAASGACMGWAGAQSVRRARAARARAPDGGRAKGGAQASACLSYLEGLSRRLALRATRPVLPVGALRGARARFEEQVGKAGLGGTVSAQACCEGAVRLAAAGAAAGALLGCAASNELAVAGCVAGGIAGATAPARAVRGARLQRAHALERSMSEMLEVVALGVRSGLSFDRSLQLYTGHFDDGLALGVRCGAKVVGSGACDPSRCFARFGARVRQPAVLAHGVGDHPLAAVRHLAWRGSGAVGGAGACGAKGAGGGAGCQGACEDDDPHGDADPSRHAAFGARARVVGAYGRDVGMIRAVMDAYRRALAKAACKVARLRHGEDGQGTTEYAILVGVLVVIAIIAITVFRPKLQELWDAIADGINSL